MSGKTKKVINRTALIRLAIILVWIASISYIVLSGGATMIFHPSYVFLPVLGVVLLLPLLVWTLMNMRTEIPVDDDGFPAESYDYSAHKVADPLQRLALFMLPPVFLLIFGVQAIDTSSLFGSGTGRLIQAGAEAEGLEIGGESGYIEITPVDLYGSELENLIGKKVKAVGMLAKEAEVPTGHFAIARLYVPCCVAMAQALYIPVEGESRAEFSGGQWLAVFGTLRRDGENVYIEPEEIVPTAQPSNPYVFG